MRPFYEDKWATILHGSCLDTDLKGITGIVTDPPYELSFMGKKWDGTGISFQPDTWRVLRECCKPGAMLLSFGGTRTFHRIAVAIEDAGWEFRDTIMWLYGSGFPKSLDISKAIDKQAGAERQITGSQKITGLTPDRATFGANDRSNGQGMGFRAGDIPFTAPSTSEAIMWSGYGTALKPAFEPILICMNPLDGTFANNALKHGVAGLNIDGCRVPTNQDDANIRVNPTKSNGLNSCFGIGNVDYGRGPAQSGRFPANFIHDGSEEVLVLFPHTSTHQGTYRNDSQFNMKSKGWGYDAHQKGYTPKVSSSSGSAARFFYCAKARRNERGEYNNHATVKPLALMEYLVRLITPPKDALILDPFMGSGTTLLGCKQLGIKCIGIELDESSCEIAAKRCQSINQEVMELVIK